MNPGTCAALKGPTKRLSAGIRTSLKACEAWLAPEGCFYLKVHITPHAQDLVSWLKGIADPAAVYFAKDGPLLALQWRLPLARYRAVYLATPHLDP